MSVGGPPLRILVTRDADAAIALYDRALRSQEVQDLHHRTAVGPTRGDLLALLPKAQQERFHTLQGQKGAVFSIAFHPDGQSLTVGGYDGKLRVYETASGKLLNTLSPVPVDSQKSLSRK